MRLNIESSHSDLMGSFMLFNYLVNKPVKVKVDSQFSDLANSASLSL